MRTNGRRRGQTGELFIIIPGMTIMFCQAGQRKQQSVTNRMGIIPIVIYTEKPRIDAEAFQSLFVCVYVGGGGGRQTPPGWWSETLDSFRTSLTAL